MARCADFYRKWQKEPNWCEKCPASVSNINSYLTIVKKLEAAGVNEEFTYVKFSENVCRNLRGASDDELEGIVPKIAEMINNPEIKKITGKQVDQLLSEERAKSRISTKVWETADPRYESPRRIGYKKVTCPECGHIFELKKRNVKFGRKKFQNEMS